LGQNLLERTLDRLRKSGVAQLSVISEGHNRSHTSDRPSHAYSNFWSAWDSLVSQYLGQGIDMLLLARLGPYVELELQPLVAFHRQTSSPLTQVYDSEGALDMVLVDAERLRSGDGSFRSRLSALIPKRQRFRFAGYSKRITSPHGFRALVQDALLGRCDIRPAGKEVRPGVWFGEGAKVDPSARIESPCYIGKFTCVDGSCTITGATAVEQRCHVDCGTMLDSCCVLPQTYVGMGLRVRGAIVAGSKLFHLQRSLELQISDPRLLGRSVMRHREFSDRVRQRATTLLQRNRLSTSLTQTASLRTTRWLGRYG
jgi:hypothetical protein